MSLPCFTRNVNVSVICQFWVVGFFNKCCVSLQVVLLWSELIESSSEGVVNCQESRELVGEVDN